MRISKPILFISCGQHAAKEKQLGASITKLVKQLRPDVKPYFAEDQSSPEGVTTNILNALHQAAGFVCIMHKRGDISVPDGETVVRGSVWIEQEIAIIACIREILKRPLPIFFYKQRWGRVRRNSLSTANEPENRVRRRGASARKPSR